MLLFSLIFSYASPCCLLARPPRPISVSPLFSGSQTLGSPEGPSRSDVRWWPREPRIRDRPYPPRRGRERAARLWPVWPEGSVCAVAWSPPPPGPAGCRHPRLGPSKHRRRQARIFIPRAGRRSSAHRSPCPALPATASSEPAWHQPAREHIADAASTQHRGHWAHCPGCQRLHCGCVIRPPPLETPAQNAHEHKHTHTHTPLRTQNALEGNAK